MFLLLFLSSHRKGSRHWCVSAPHPTRALVSQWHFSSLELYQLGQGIPLSMSSSAGRGHFKESVSLIFYCKNVGCGINLVFFWSIINVSVCSEVGNKASNRHLGAAGIEPRLRQVLLEHNKHFPYFPCLDALLSFGSLLSSQCSFLSKIYPAKAPTLNSSGEAFMVQPSPSSSELYSCL